MAVDAATKAWARSTLAGSPRHLVGPLWLRLSANSGVSFSIGQHWPLVAGILEGVALLAVAVAALFVRPGAPAAGFGLLVGGGAANLIERLVSSAHEVTDFVSVGSFPTFNLADASVTVGFLLLLVVVLRGHRLLGDR